MDRKEIKCSLVVATYNWPSVLSLSLQSLLRQTVLPSEIIIADDGSTDATKLTIDNFRKQTNIPVKHIWHKDDGFRKTIILNEAIRQSSESYIVETDGDIILHHKFIEDHLDAAKPGAFIRGSRGMMTKAATENILAGKQEEINFFSAGIQNRLNALRSPFISQIHNMVASHQKNSALLGCNFSFWKKDFVDVNGYNNDMTGWGHEDSELAARLINNGVARRVLKFKAVCFHLYHAINARHNERTNTNMWQQAINNKIKVCKNGYNNLHHATVWQ